MNISVIFLNLERRERKNCYKLTLSITAERKETVNYMIAQYQDDLPKPVQCGKRIFSMEKKVEVIVEKRLPVHHCLSSKRL